jgi:alpha-N-arabinofuranosidase
VILKYTPKSEKDLAGVVCYQSEKFNYVFGITKKESDNYLVLARTEKGITRVIASEKIDVRNPVQLQVEAQGDNYKFNYATDKQNFKNIGGMVSGDILSTNVAGGFTGSLIGLYATAANDIQL